MSLFAFAATDKVALLIGNYDYRSQQSLKAPQTDIQNLSHIFQRVLGFKVAHRQMPARPSSVVFALATPKASHLLHTESPFFLSVCLSLSLTHTHTHTLSLFVSLSQLMHSLWGKVVQMSETFVSFSFSMLLHFDVVFTFMFKHTKQI